MVATGAAAHWIVYECDSTDDSNYMPSYSLEVVPCKKNDSCLSPRQRIKKTHGFPQWYNKKREVRQYYEKSRRNISKEKIFPDYTEMN